jgi:hypothetical protein
MMGFCLYRLGKLAGMTRRDLLAGLLATPALAGYGATAASGQRLEVSLRIATEGDL